MTNKTKKGYVEKLAQRIQVGVNTMAKRQVGNDDLSKAAVAAHLSGKGERPSQSNFSILQKCERLKWKTVRTLGRSKSMQVYPRKRPCNGK